MSDTMGQHNTLAPAQPADPDRQLADRQEQMAHADDAEKDKRAMPNQAMHTRNVTTASDAQASDQRMDGVSTQMSGDQDDRHEKLGTPVAERSSPEDE